MSQRMEPVQRDQTKRFPCVQTDPPAFRFATRAAGPGHRCEEPGSVILVPPPGVCAHGQSSPSITFSRCSPSALSLPSDKKRSDPFTIRAALCRPRSGMSTSPSSWGAQDWSTHTRNPHRYHRPLTNISNPSIFSLFKITRLDRGGE